MFLQIDGWRGAGKGAIWTLLDGHKQIFCSPIHDISFEGFMTVNNDDEFIKNKDIRSVRKIFNKTEYYKFESFSHEKKFYLDFSSDDRLVIPFNFDFYNFDKFYFSELIKKEYWSIQFLIEKLYESVHKFYLPNNHLRKIKYYVAMGGSKDWRNTLFHHNLPNAKCIQVRRSLEGILSTICNRKKNPLDKSSNSSYSRSFEQRIKEDEIEKILTYYEAYDHLIHKYPDVYYKVEFQDVILKTKETMERIAEFLNIKFDNILTIASRDGKELISNGKKYVGEVYDNPSDLLSNKELSIINRRKRIYKIHKLNYYPLNKNNFKKNLKLILK